MMKVGKARKPLGNRLWFKLILTFMLFIPAYASLPYDPTKTSEVITAVLAAPWVTAIPWLLPLTKLLMLSVILVPLILKKPLTKVLVAYYGFVLIVVGLFQNMAVTEEYGFTWLIGNTLAQFVVASYCFFVFFRKSKINEIEVLEHRRLWLLIPMLLAFLMPYGVNNEGVIVPELSLAILTNEATVTYCMITPVVIGLFLLFPQAADKPLLSVVSYVGLLYGLFNMLTWFVFDSAQWWMGVLHLPLFFISIYGLAVARQGKASPGP